jgi:hypothetical protein
MKILALIFLVSAAFAQEHAPTPEQCRADYRLWTAKGTDFADVSFRELMRRSHVMSGCSTTDPGWEQEFARDLVRLGKNAGVSYSDLTTLFHAAAGDKATDFLMRHHLMDQFLKEDEVGKRTAESTIRQ